mgnify:FL=1
MSSVEVENTIAEFPSVEDCSVYGVSVPHTDGKCGMAAIVLRHGTNITDGE